METETPLRAGLVEACDDPDLFGIELTERQRQLLQAVEAGDLLHVWALGRRSGKTLLAVLVALWTLLLRPELREHLRRRERLYAAAVATNLRQSRIFVEQGRSIIEGSRLAPLIESVSDDEIRFRNRSVLAAFPCTSRGVRGWPIAALLLDEAAHMLDSDGNQAAGPVFRSLTPSVAQFGEAGRVIVASSPFGVDGFFAETFHAVEAGELPAAACVQAGTLDVRPDFAQAALELERRRDPSGFQAEYGAEFVPAGDSFIDLDLVRQAVGRKHELRPGEVAEPIGLLDLGLVVDSTGFVVMGRDRKDLNLLRVVLARSWTPAPGKPLSLSATLDEVAAICKEHGVRQLYLDQYHAQGAREELRRHGLHASIVSTTPASKSEMYADLRSRIYDGSIELYDNPALLSEFSLLETVTTPGRATVRSRRASGSHGDMVSALALGASKLRPIQGSGIRVLRARGDLPVREGERVRLASRFGQAFGGSTFFARRRERRYGGGPKTALDRKLEETAGLSRWTTETGQNELAQLLDRVRGGQ